MAKKKRVKAKSAKRTGKKGKSTAASRRTRVANKKTSVTKTAPKRPATKKQAAPRASGNTSVDTLLGRFAKERAAKEVQLASLTKKKQEIEEKARKFREQIEKLALEERKSRDEIAQLDVRRDQEVGQLLSRLGVQLANAAPSPRPPDSAPQKTSSIMKAARDRVRQSLSNSRDEE